MIFVRKQAASWLSFIDLCQITLETSVKVNRSWLKICQSKVSEENFIVDQ